MSDFNYIYSISVMSQMNTQSWVSRFKLETSGKQNVPRESDLKDSILQLDLTVKAGIQDLWQCEGGFDELQETHEAARRKLAELKHCIEQFRTIAQEQDDVKVKLDMDQSANFYEEQMQTTNTALRKAFLTKKIAIDEAVRKNLLSGAGSAELRRRHQAEANREGLVRTANDITESLLSISRVMNDSVQQSAESLSTLVSSSSTLKNTNEELKDQSGVIQTSHRLLTKYNRREFTDKFLIFLALAFFFSTVLYILKKRLLPV